MSSYIPSTLAEREKMLTAIGMTSIDDVYSTVPQDVIHTKKLEIPDGKSQMEILSEMSKIADKNIVFPHIFRGAGAYNHFIPSIVKYIASKEEFVTAYTPYQAEISQGVLQSIFEYQTEMSELTGLPVCNASIYDGATAAAEATAMCRERKRTKAYVSATVHPDYIEVIQTYCTGANAEVVIIPAKNGITDIEALKLMLDDTTACVFTAQPNFYGLFEDCAEIANIAHDAGAKYIMGCNPMALAIMKTPGECGADIAIAEGQPFGMPLAFGGPYLGVITCNEKLLRKIPGRIVGQTTDASGERCFVLTLQAREQHIRREKSFSNICSNQALCALTSTIYLATVGPDGLRNVATQCMSKAHYLAEQLIKIKGFKIKYNGEFFHEFVTTCPSDVNKLMKALESKGILGGFPVDIDNEPCIIWCTTEMNSKSDIDMLVDTVKEVVA